MQTNANKQNPLGRGQQAVASSPAPAKVGQQSTAGKVLEMQRSVGNQAVQRMLQAKLAISEPSDRIKNDPELNFVWEKALIDLMNQKEDQETLAILIEGELLHAEPDAYAALYKRLSHKDPPAGDKLVVKFNRTFTGQIRQKLLARFKEVGRHWSPIVQDPFPDLAPGIAPGRESHGVHTLGRIKAPKGVRLRQRPAIRPIEPIVPFDTLVFIDHKTVEKEGKQSWLFVVALGDDYLGQNVTATGFVEEYFIAQKPPEPTAHLYLVKPGDMLKDIAARYYKHGFTWGNDARIYVQAIYHANKGRNVVFRQGVALEVDHKTPDTSNLAGALKLWGEARVVSGQSLWIPSNDFVQRLKASNIIHHASISKEAWDTTVNALQELMGLAKYSAGFIIGLMGGALNALSDLFMGVVDLIKALWAVVKILLGDINSLKELARKVEELWKNRSKAVDAIIAGFSKNWNDENDYKRGKFQGEVLGYAIMTVFIIYVTFGAGATAIGTGRLGGFIKLIQFLDKTGDIITYTKALTKIVKLPTKVFDKARDALKGKVLDSDIRKIKPVPKSSPLKNADKKVVRPDGVFKAANEPKIIDDIIKKGRDVTENLKLLVDERVVKHLDEMRPAPIGFQLEIPIEVDHVALRRSRSNWCVHSMKKVCGIKVADSVEDKIDVHYKTLVIKEINKKDNVFNLTEEQIKIAISKIGVGKALNDTYSGIWKHASNSDAMSNIQEVNRLLKNKKIDAAKKLARETYNNWRRRFWRKVWDNHRKDFIDAGFMFDNKGGVPYYVRSDGRKERLTLDHIIRLSDDPTRALDSSNLQFSLSQENSVLLEGIRNSPFNRGLETL